MKEQIASFQGTFRFLSNFWPCKVVYEDMEYPSTEHAYQAAKCVDLKERKKIQQAKTPGEAKKLGRKVKIRSDWEDIKVSVMYELVKQKFKNPDLRNLLLMTENVYICENNWWNDRFWGKCENEDGKMIGENMLGKILMDVREKIQQMDSSNFQ